MRLFSFLAIAILAFAMSVAGFGSRHIGRLNRGLRYRGLLNALGGAPKMWFNGQKQDHFDMTNSKTWAQKYYMNDTYWKPGNPIFLMLGGEGPVSSACVSDHYSLSNYAQQFGALVICVEHRFYGESMPTADVSTANLRLLSTEQALADYAYFRRYITDLLQTPTSKWIAFGGSYSGSLSAWIRLKYPHLFDGSISSSAPLEARLDFPQYFEVVHNSLGPDCSARLKQANDQVQSLLTTPVGRAALKDKFTTCNDTGLTSELDIATFLEGLSDPVAGIVQYNHDNNHYQPFDIDKACGVLMKPMDPLQGLADLVHAINAFENTTCVSTSYSQAISDLQANSAGRSWTWQTCTEFGFYQTGESKVQPFSPRISLDYFLATCQDAFGIKGLIPDTNQMNTDFGSLAIASATSNTVFSNGDVDPWHVLGLPTGAASNSPSSTSILMKGTAHCADLYPASPSDVSDLTNLRQIQLAYLKKWLSE